MIMFEDLPDQILKNSESYMPDSLIDHNSIRKACLETLLQANCSVSIYTLCFKFLSFKSDYIMKNRCWNYYSHAFNNCL